jgi:hypothetical protein
MKKDFIWNGRYLPKSIYRSCKFKNTKGIAEAVSIDKVVQNKDGEYAVCIVIVFHKMSLYRAYLKMLL